MAKQNISTLKNWFKRGLKPLQSQFWDWMDSYWHRDEKIPIATIDGLIEILNNLGSGEALEALIESFYGQTIVFSAPGTYTIPANRWLEKILVKPSQDINFKVGTAAGQEDLVLEQPIEAARPQVITLDHYAPQDKTIYLSGFTSPVTIIFYKR